ncbi:MAG: LexA family protein [Candidatus Kapaibacterium sp.]
MRHDIGTSQGNSKSSDLTSTQREVLDCIVKHFEEEQVVPDVSVILQQTGKKSRTNLYRILRQLSEKGYIELGKGESGVRLRYKLTKRARLKGEKSWPLLGVIPAGPIQSASNMQHDVISNLADIIPDMEGSDRVIRVTGNWMKGRGILAGDFVVISPLRDYQPRDICALSRSGSPEIILAQVRQLRSTTVLTFDSEEHSAKTLRTEEVIVHGVVTAHISLTSFVL